MRSSASLGALCLASCASFALTSVTGDAAAGTLVRLAAPAVAEHVYVQDPKAATLFRFPIVNGVIASQPDATLATPAGAAGVAIGPDGKIYVSDSNASQILIYRAGARGHELPRVTIPVPTRPVELAVAKDGFLFARLDFLNNGTSEVAVISPQHQIVNIIDETAATSLALDSMGNLYVGSDEYFHVYATPETTPTLIRSVCMTTVFLAVGPNDHLYVARFTSITRVRDTLNGCPVPKGRFEIRAVVAPQLFLPYIAVDGAHLFTVEITNRRVLQLDPNNGNPQTPIANIQLPAFVYPYAIAVGP